MKVEITAKVEIVSIAHTFPEDEEPATILKLKTKLPPAEVARILNIQRQGAPLTMTIGTEQLAFDLSFSEVKGRE
ncbi:MAG: hypothetical protein A2Y72_03590 [Chloroflexi bacterium RBG_13_53_26]|nr:MAG: hypothetical protein A2Y72_03590 [Chloroflexi bacterium RBG_13_53_26]